MPPADLTPAVDKFVRFPSPSSSPLKESYFLTAKGPSPEGPEPFSLVSDELQPLSDYVKELLVSENPVLTMAASHFFDSLQGKRFRPTIVALMARALIPTLGTKNNKSVGTDTIGTDSVSTGTIFLGKMDARMNKLQLQLGQITEMIHVASLIHDDVLDEAETRRGGKAVHTVYTNKVAVLAGDYLLARASVLLARLQHLQVVEVMASALDALVFLFSSFFMLFCFFFGQCEVILVTFFSLYFGDVF
jgi:geranylgeranyl pyrophosphate synthase